MPLMIVFAISGMLHSSCNDFCDWKISKDIEYISDEEKVRICPLLKPFSHRESIKVLTRLQLLHRLQATVHYHQHHLMSALGTHLDPFTVVSFESLNSM